MRFNMTSIYHRVLLKISGEAFGESGESFSESNIASLVHLIDIIRKQGIELIVVVGGGNIMRGSRSKLEFMDRSHADHAGMLATIINGLVLRDALKQIGVRSVAYTPWPICNIIDAFHRDKAKRSLAQGKVVICVGGTGHPFFTTDSAASLRALELDAELLMKATHVDGVYDKDPLVYPDAKKFHSLSYQEALVRQLHIMDAFAFAHCMAHQLPICVFNASDHRALIRILEQQDPNEGTWIC